METLNSPLLHSDPLFSQVYPIAVRLASILGLSQESAEAMLSGWYEPHRYYHTIEHLLDLRDGLGDDWHRDEVFLTAVFHDIVYDPFRNDNEARSADFFRVRLSSKFKEENAELVESVTTAILESSHTEPPISELGKLFCKVDLSILTDSDLHKLVDYELKIFKEFQAAPYDIYKKHRIAFLEKWTDRNAAISQLIEFIRYRQVKVGVYAGSFDPFTIGHMNILKKAEQIFDKVIIARGLNPMKEMWTYELPPCLDHHEQILVGDFSEAEKKGLKSRSQAIQKERNLASTMMSRVREATLVRGLRDGNDLDSEKIQQIYVQQIMGDTSLKVAYITCDKEYEHVSSTAFKMVNKVDEHVASSICPNGAPKKIDIYF